MTISPKRSPQVFAIIRTAGLDAIESRKFAEGLPLAEIVSDTNGRGILSRQRVPDNCFATSVATPAPGNILAPGNAKEPPFRSLATIKLPDHRKRFLATLLPHKDQPLRAIVLRSDDPAFRPGQIMIMNFAPGAIAAELGGENLTFTPGSQTIFRPQRRNDPANYQVRFNQAKEGKPEPFATSL